VGDAYGIIKAIQALASTGMPRLLAPFITIRIDDARIDRRPLFRFALALENWLYHTTLLKNKFVDITNMKIHTSCQ